MDKYIEDNICYIVFFLVFLGGYIFSKSADSLQLVIIFCTSILSAFCMALIKTINNISHK